MYKIHTQELQTLRKLKTPKSYSNIDLNIWCVCCLNYKGIFLTGNWQTEFKIY